VQALPKWNSTHAAALNSGAPNKNKLFREQMGHPKILKFPSNIKPRLLANND
jgi:hypothetical protein